MTFYREVVKFYTWLFYISIDPISHLLPQTVMCSILWGTACIRFSQVIYIHVEINVRAVCTLRAQLWTTYLTHKPQLDTLIQWYLPLDWNLERKKKKKYNDSLTQGKSNSVRTDLTRINSGGTGTFFPGCLTDKNQIIHRNKNKKAPFLRSS